MLNQPCISVIRPIYCDILVLLQIARIDNVFLEISACIHKGQTCVSLHLRYLCLVSYCDDAVA